jgi:hypothetical protein
MLGSPRGARRARKASAVAVAGLLALSVAAVVTDTAPWWAALLVIGLLAAAAAAMIRALLHASILVLAEATLRAAVGAAVALVLCLFAYYSGAATLGLVAVAGLVAAARDATRPGWDDRDADSPCSA